MGFPLAKLNTVIGQLLPDCMDLLSQPRETLINLGAGEDVHGTDDRFLNIDGMDGYPSEPTEIDGILKAKADATSTDDLHRLCKPGSAWIVFAHHFFEHVDYRQARDVLKTWAGLLKPGGVMYICVPEPLWVILHALGLKEVLPKERQWNGDPEAFAHYDRKLDSFEMTNDLIYSHGDHRSCWWPQALAQAFKDAGLERVQQYANHCDPNGGWLSPCELIMVGVKS